MIARALILFLVFIFSGCKRYNMERIEDIFSLTLNGKIKYEKIEEQWNDFNGDGYKIINFKIDKSEQAQLIDEAIKAGFVKIPYEDLKSNFNTAELKYLECDVYTNTKYMTNQTERITIDSCNNLLIYYYALQ
jgi:hypothetical protein